MDGFVLIFLVLFFLVITLYVIGFFLVLYHLIRFGVGVQPKKYALIFMAGSVFLLFTLSLGLILGYSSMKELGMKSASALKSVWNIKTEKTP